MHVVSNKPENIIKVQVNWKKSIQGPYYFELRQRVLTNNYWLMLIGLIKLFES